MKKKIKILFVVGSLNCGGTELHILNLLSNLDEKKYDINIRLLIEKGDLVRSFSRNNIKIYFPIFDLEKKKSITTKILKLINLIDSFLFIFMYAIKNKDTILHFFLPASYIIGGLAGILARHKKMIMSRRSLNFYQNKLIYNLEKKMHNFMNSILGNSKSVLLQLNKLEDVNEKKLSLIYNGIDVKSLKSKSI